MSEWRHWFGRVEGKCDKDKCPNSSVWEAKYIANGAYHIFQWCDECFNDSMRERSIEPMYLGLSEADFWKELEL